ncbi:Metallo-dependent hydrolase [Penicillium capsulatum]|uniref:Metallo-dependent hydrolase n=1 Tax=Penicillium capsulatum TaxID=69766 RepID=A0A9W9HZ24_9EURO|nr:Metallo-dependent hydrolase [Penicillium capsulatum]
MMDLSTPVDSVFTRGLPKVELHAHLSGSISRQCLHEIWALKRARDPTFPIEDPLVLMPPGKVDYTLQTSSPNSYTSYAVIWKASSMQLTPYWKTFVTTESNTWNYGPFHVQPPSSNITREEYLNTVLDVVETFKAKNTIMSVFLILALDRGNTTAAEATEIVDLAIANKSRGVVGVDLCGNPTQGDVNLYRPAFARAKSHGLGVTLHFAETAASGTPSELADLLSFQPDRLGHVIHVPDDVKREIARQRLGLELCMSCNVHAKLIDGGFLNHHFGHWRHTDCPIALCTDDVGLFCSPVSNEYLLASEHFGLGRADLLHLCRKSVDAIFGGELEKQRLRERLDAFAGQDSGVGG